MRAWFADSVFRTVLRNVSYLLTGKFAGALFSLLAFACAGRALSPDIFGILMVVHSYASGAGGLVKFQTWQFIVREATPALEHGQPERARDIIRFSFGLDISSGLIGMVAAMAALPLLAEWFGINEATLPLAMIYCTLVPTMTAATATGILRVLNRFDLIAAQEIVTPVLRAGGAVLSYFGDYGFFGFLVTWYLSDLAGDLVLWLLAARELHRRGMLAALKPGLFGTAKKLPGAWAFVWTTNAAHSIYAAWGPLSNLVVAAILGPAAAGLYKIASTLLDAASKPADLLRRSYFPEIMRLDPRERRPWLLGLRAGALAGGVAILVVLLVLVGGRPLITVVFGAKYIQAFGVLKLMTVSMIFALAFFPLESLLYMAHRQSAALVAQFVAVAGYLALLAALTHAYGLDGAGVAYLAGNIAVALCMLIPTIGAYRRRQKLAWAMPS